MISRRKFMGATACGATAYGLSGLLPSWARGAVHGNMGLTQLSATTFDLKVGKFPVNVNGRGGEAIGVNGTMPAPLIRFREGDDITINVTNELEEDTSIHWHGLLVPFQMDGVPGVTFPGIRPHETFTYKFSVPQSGTYWYHSHSGLQEPLGHYGPLIIDPKHHDPVQYDREYVLVLSDWSFESPYRIFSKLKSESHTYNFQQRTLPDFLQDAKKRGLGAAWSDREMWGQMRMSPRDISDVTGATFDYLINGHGTSDNWNGVFNVGERVRLRIINASSMTLFNVRIPGLPMTIVNSDGLNVQPIEVDEFQMGVAETYDVIVQPHEAKPFAFVAESIDRSGQVVATLGPRPGLRAPEPKMRTVPTLTMKDMGMDHEAMGHTGHMDQEEMIQASDGHAMSPSQHSAPDPTHEHHTMDHAPNPAHQMHDQNSWPVETKHIQQGVGVANKNASPMNRLDEPGIGLENVSHRVLRYTQLKSLDRNPDTRQPEREIEIHLTSNMERYMWSFDGVKFSEVKEAIKFHEGERVRVTLVNNTMMPHPIHLHGMFFDLVNGMDDHKPRKHTVVVKPAEKLAFDVSAEHIGDWAFHCHLLYHMHAGMMHVVSVVPKKEAVEHKAGHHPDHSDKDHMTQNHKPNEATHHSTVDHSQMKHHEMEHHQQREEQ